MRNKQKTAVIVFWLALAFLTLVSPAGAAPYDDKIASAASALQAGKFQDAFAAAGEAIQLDPNRYEGHFLGGLALYKLDTLDSAVTYFQKALALAPDDQKPKVQEALTTATNKKDFVSHYQTAQQAEGDGLFAKAAQEYTAAWDGFEVGGIKIREDAGLKAAHLWAEHIQTPAESAHILNYIIAHPQDLTVLQQAKDFLASLQPALDQVYSDKLKAGQDALAQGEMDDALKALTLAERAKPDSQEVHLALARVYAKQNDYTHATQEIIAAVKLKPVKVEAILVPEFERFLQQPKFLTFVGDALGPEAMKTATGGLASSAAPRQTRINPKDGAEMIYIPPSPFLMGDADADHNPRHTVTLSSYWMYKNDVTVAMYGKFCQATGRTMPNAPVWGWKDDHPVVNVSWDDAKAYCDWAGVHLPTEAQWEKAARGLDGRKYPWGNAWDNSRLQCSHSQVGDANSTAPVGSFPSGASPFGCLDMAGNVFQWCADWYDENYWRNDHGKDPAGPSSGKNRVLRGGSWSSIGDEQFRAAYRLDMSPRNRYADSGFRGASGP